MIQLTPGQLRAFADLCTEAWCSQDPERVVARCDSADMFNQAGYSGNITKSPEDLCIF